MQFTISIGLLFLTCTTYGRRLQSSAEFIDSKRRVSARATHTPLEAFSLLVTAFSPTAAFNPVGFPTRLLLCKSVAASCHLPRCRKSTQSYEYVSTSALPRSIQRVSSCLLCEAAKRQTSRNQRATLLRLVRPDWPRLCIAFAALTLAATADALQPGMQALALNVALGVEVSNSCNLGGALARLAIVGAVSALFSSIRGRLFWNCGARLVARLRETIFSALVHQPQAFHDAQGQGTLSQRLATDCIKLGDVLTYNVNIMLRELLQAVIGVYIVVRMNAHLASLVLIGVALRTMWSRFYAKASRRLQKRSQDALAASSEVAEQCMSLVKVVRAHGNEKYEDSRYVKKLDLLLENQKRHGALYGTSRVVNGGLDITLAAGVLGLGGYFVSNGWMPMEALTSFVMYSTFVSSALSNVIDQWASIQTALGAATSVFDYLVPRSLDGTLPANGTTSGAESVQRATSMRVDDANTSGKRGALVFDRVDFAYPSRPTSPVLKDVSLSVNPGESVAVVGGSGSGKSTIFALAQRFYQPASGRVIIDDVPVDHIDEPTLRSSIAWVQQEPPLFPDATISENIAYGLSNVTHAQIEAAAREANAYEFVEGLPQGFDTRLTGSGASLSGGQKQRIALARALVRDPALLLLDEATSALDPKSERLVEAAIQRASEKRTVIFTTHKVTQAQNADRIIVMSRGEIVEQGTHEELIRCNGAYVGLLRAGDSISEEEASAVVDRSVNETSECAV